MSDDRNRQADLFAAAGRPGRTALQEPPPPSLPPLQGQLLKWIGNKQRFAAEIVACFPERIGCYFEPFVGSGAVLATLAPAHAVASDILAPLIDIHRAVQADPEGLVARYGARREALVGGDAKAVYLQAREAYNANPNADDLLFLARTCYGGVIRFSKRGEMNTPLGPHRPISAATLQRRIAAWRPRIAAVEFRTQDFEVTIDSAGRGDLVYCDPPYSDSEGTLYGAQAFALARLIEAIGRAKGRGAHVALSIDGSKRSGDKVIDLDLPEQLFPGRRMVRVGRSMLRRFQLEGQTLEHEVVHDRLLTTWR